MLTLRSLAIAMAAAGVLAGLPARSAQACDNDRYPCPVVAQPQEADAAVRSPQSRKKASRAAPQDEQARAKGERQTSQAPSQTNPAAQEQAANAASRKERGVVPARNEEAGHDEGPGAADAAGTGAQAAAGDDSAGVVGAAAKSSSFTSLGSTHFHPTRRDGRRGIVSECIRFTRCSLRAGAGGTGTNEGSGWCG